MPWDFRDGKYKSSSCCRLISDLGSEAYAVARKRAEEANGDILPREWSEVAIVTHAERRNAYRCLPGCFISGPRERFSGLPFFVVRLSLIRTILSVVYTPRAGISLHGGIRK
jgi:hypothetical protein